MKIDNSVTSVGGLSNSESRTRSVKGPPAMSVIPGGAQVEMSSLTSRLQELQGAAANAPVVDAARVAEVKQAISEGRFQVNADKVADSLIHSVRQLLNTQTNRA